MRDAAIQYAGVHGIPVFPIRPRTKKPATAHGFYDASTVAARVNEMWSANPGANIGGRMGSGIVCLDFDKDDGKGYDSTDWLAAWEHDHGRLPETARAVTGRGGVHLYYRVSKAVSASVNEDLHIDVRGDGSYVMMPPSVHPNGTTYYWDEDPDDVGIADADANVYALIKAVQDDDEQVEQTHTRREPAKDGDKIAEGGRNAALYSKACSMRSAGLTGNAIYAALLTYNREACVPPLDESEVKTIANSVAKLPAGHSDEVRAQEAQKAAQGGLKPTNHVVVSTAAIEQCGVCYIDGFPAAREGGTYAGGWPAVERALLEVCPPIKASQRQECCKWLALKMPRRERSPHTLIGFTNGVVDVVTGTLREYRDDDVIVNQIPHAYDPDADNNGKASAFLKRLANGNYATYENLIEVLGLCIMSTAAYGICPVLLGEGSNGKSTFIAVIKAVVGDENMSALQPADIGSRFQAEMLVGKLANLGDDIANNFLDGNACSQIKKVVTGNTIHTDVKGGRGFDFVPYATMVFSANEFPRLGDTTYGMLRRFHPIPFNARFSPSDKDYNPNILDELTTPEVMSEFCLLAVIGANRIVEHNCMTPNAKSEEILRVIREDNNSVAEWLADNSILRADLVGMSIAWEYDRYCDWCSDANSTAYSRKRFTRTVCVLCELESVSARNDVSMKVEKVFRARQV